MIIIIFFLLHITSQENARDLVMTFALGTLKCLFLLLLGGQNNRAYFLIFLEMTFDNSNNTKEWYFAVSQDNRQQLVSLLEIGGEELRGFIFILVKGSC